MDSEIRGAKLTTLEVEGHGDSAHEVGPRDGGRWKLHRDIWTTSQAPPKP